jgi:hypothetical protein
MNRKAAEGDREAQFSLGCLLGSEAREAAGTPPGTRFRSPKADVGFAFCTANFRCPLTHQTETRRCDHLIPR